MLRMKSCCSEDVVVIGACPVLTLFAEDALAVWSFGPFESVG